MFSILSSLNQTRRQVMKPMLFMPVLTVMLTALSVFAQEAQLSVTTTTPAAEQEVHIQVNMRPGPNLSIAWKKMAGEGEFIGPINDRAEVIFRPARSGDIVIIVCEIRTPNGIYRPETKLTVGGASPSALPSNEKTP